MADKEPLSSPGVNSTTTPNASNNKISASVAPAPRPPPPKNRLFETMKNLKIPEYATLAEKRKARAKSEPPNNAANSATDDKRIVLQKYGEAEKFTKNLKEGLDNAAFEMETIVPKSEKSNETQRRCPSPSAPVSTGTLHRNQVLSGFPGEDGDIVPSAPPLEVLDTVTGYEDLSFDSVSVPPPEPYGEFELLDPAQQMLGTWAPPNDSTFRASTPHMTEAMAQAALLSHVKSHCCWGLGPARHMTISSIRDVYAYHYVLHTFTEKREARWAWAPHVGGDVDGPEQGRAPSPWDIPALPSKPFHNEVKAFEVPHTAAVKPCHRCRGAGTLGCPHCHGKGWTRCMSCHGDGFGLGTGLSRERCIVCAASTHGHGRQDCSRCGAKGRVSCAVCDSYGQLKCFIQLSVSWKVTVGEHVTGGDDLSPDLIRQVEGQIGLEETGVRLTALPPDIMGPDETLATASAHLINDHLEHSADALLLAQRHQVRMVPITVIDYQWKRHHGKFYIYGLDKQVSAPKYPTTFCCGCSIL